MEIVLFWIFASIIVGMLAAKKNRSFVLYFLLSILFSPLLIGLLVLVLSLPPAQQPEPNVTAIVKPITVTATGGQVNCGLCKKSNRAGDLRCKHCGTALPTNG